VLSDRSANQVEWTSLAHVNRLATETQSRITREWIQERLKRSCSYTPKKKWGIPAALKKIPKRKVAVFLQMASGYGLIGIHLVGIKKEESDACWWCDSGRKQSRGHLFGGCRAWKREYLALKKRVEKITGKKRGRGQRRNERGARLKVVDLFKDERLTEAVLEFLQIRRLAGGTSRMPLRHHSRISFFPLLFLQRRNQRRR
jgi:hypothetical protein